jgi:hypothetical protein
MQNQTPFFTRLLDGALPTVKSGVKAGTGAEFTYTPTGPNTAVLTDVIYNPTPWPPADGDS